MGINLRKNRPTPEEVSQAVEKLLTVPTYRQNAQRLQADFSQHNASQRAAELLEGLALRYRELKKPATT